MVIRTNIAPHYIDPNTIPEKYPTHLHSTEFWEALGRAVATFGHLEEVLARAIFALTGTKELRREPTESDFEDWLKQLKNAMREDIGALIKRFKNVIECDNRFNIIDYEELFQKIGDAVALRNVICHGSWRAPNAYGASVPLFVDRNLRVFETPIDLNYLLKSQIAVAELSIAIRNIVTTKGIVFPGASEPDFGIQ